MQNITEMGKLIDETRDIIDKMWQVLLFNAARVVCPRCK